MMTVQVTRDEGGDAATSHTAPVLRMELEAEAQALREGEAWRTTGHAAKTLVKHEDLRVVLIALAEGARLHEHVTDHGIAVQTVRGRLRLALPEEVVELPAGTLLALGRGIPHDVVALEESVFLLTVSWDASS